MNVLKAWSRRNVQKNVDGLLSGKVAGESELLAIETLAIGL